MFRSLLTFFTKAPTSCSELDWIDDCFRRGGFLYKSHWGQPELRRAAQVLTVTSSSSMSSSSCSSSGSSITGKTLKVPFLALPSNSFDAGGLRVLMRLLAQRDELKQLQVSVRSADDVRAISEAFAPGALDRLLIDLEFGPQQPEDDDDAAAALRELVHIPTQSLELTFCMAPHHQAHNFAAALHALRKGCDDIKNNEKNQGSQLPRIVFRNVLVLGGADDRLLQNTQAAALASLQLPSMVSAICDTNILKGLELSPLGGLNAEFFQALVPLLAKQDSCLTELRITQGKALVERNSSRRLNQNNYTNDSASTTTNAAIMEEFRQALAHNTSLRVFSLRHNSVQLGGSLWTQAIFPALVQNRTLRTLDFGHARDEGVMECFLQLLPTMSGGLRHVTAPWHAALGARWIETLHGVESLWRVDFPADGGSQDCNNARYHHLLCPTEKA